MIEEKHKLHQRANNWIMCSCGKLFANSRKGRVTAEEKFEEHLMEKLKEGL